jgi:hypothetical protein
MARKKKQPTDEPQENLDNSDDTFGLPEVDYQPLKRDEPKAEEPPPSEEPPVSEEKVVVINETNQVTPEPAPAETSNFQYTSQEPTETSREMFEPKDHVEEHHTYQPTYNYEEERPSVWPKVLGFLFILALAGVAIWYFASYRPEQQAKEAERIRKEQLAEEEARKKEEQRLAAERAAEEEARKAAEVKATPDVGTIETLSGRSGRYYVVVASAIDGDLIMDYAKKLSAKGVSTKIIPPFGKSAFHRLAVADGDTYQTTQETADGLKGGDYGDKVWVVKY